MTQALLESGLATPPLEVLNMMMLPELGLLFFFGAIAGVLSGLLGIGGGVVIVPFLVWHFAALGFKEELIMVMAVGSSLTTILFTAVSSSWAHHRRGMIDWSTVKRLSPGLLIGSSFGAMAANRLLSGYRGEMCGVEGTKVVSHPISFVLSTEREIDSERLWLVTALS
ncbi:MAG: hypothetical protein EBY15_12135 [Gammaproteobacteria bacterium]|nr:hypothetical protein [Gammaproteobacteria bacterium]